MQILSSLSNREKNIWTTLILDFIVALYFFPKVFRMDWSSGLNGGEITKVIITVIIISIIGSILISVFLGAGKDEEMDERDSQFEAKANSVGYHAMFVAIIFLIGHIILNEITEEIFKFSYEAMPPLKIAVYMMVVLVAASFLKELVRIFYYRRGY